MHVLLDVSRFLGCSRRRAPSGIDRVEVAYARRWLAEPACAVTFVARGARGSYAAVPRGLVQDLADQLHESWTGGANASSARRAARFTSLLALARLALGRGRGRVEEVTARERRSVFLLVSHRLMEQPEPIEDLRRAGAAFIPLVHDLIPATHPEYARPGVAMQHLQRLATVASLADGVISNSAATADVLRPHLAQRSCATVPPVLVAPLGIEALGSTNQTGMAAGTPYFVAVGTIEPRKNHLLLLHLWRDFAAKWGAAAPRLVLVGRRGWENENVLDLLERCALLRGVVQEAGSISDPAVGALLAGSRALLFPSFAEGYGLPLAEALSVGTPAICSNLPALREVGGSVPEYLDPLDGAGWRRMILDYVEPDSRSRAAQLARMRSWSPPSWGEHFAAVDKLMDKVVARGAIVHAAPVRRPEHLSARPAGSLLPEPLVVR